MQLSPCYTVAISTTGSYRNCILLSIVVTAGLTHNVIQSSHDAYTGSCSSGTPVVEGATHCVCYSFAKVVCVCV